MSARFGTAGNSDSFTAQGYKSSVQAPGYLVKMGLDAYEYQGGRGITIKQEKAELLGAAAGEAGVALSVHAPYYISLSGTDEVKRLNSIGYILQSARAAKWMGAQRIVVHSGSCGGQTREAALALAGQTLGLALAALDAEGLGAIRLCPETMGRINQLGTLEEVLELCSIDERLLPCIDFGHLNARTGGGLSAPQAVEAVFEAVKGRLGEERLKSFHSHFSKIEYTAGGEKRHLTFEDTTFGPDFGPVAEMTVRYGCHPVFICESAGTQAEDAVAMKAIYQKAVERLEKEC
ncbi:MAG: TIM barrel protein [Clostridia bacterium]|nr:TIM barrel protein [Clostridia bacterium]